MNIDFKYGIGPVWTNWGRKNHNLLLGSSEVVAWPYSQRASLRLGLSLELLRFLDPGEVVRQQAITGGLTEESIVAEGAVRYAVDTLQEIRVESRWMQNAIVFWPLGGSPVAYRLHFREQTDACRQAFKQLYPNIYKELGFDGSFLTRLLKS